MTRISTFIAALALAGMASTSAHAQSTEEVLGTVLGGSLGAVIGGEIDGGRNKTDGQVIGALVGGSLGYVIGDRVDDRNDDQRRYRAYNQTQGSYSRGYQDATYGYSRPVYQQPTYRQPVYSQPRYQSRTVYQSPRLTRVYTQPAYQPTYRTYQSQPQPRYRRW